MRLSATLRFRVFTNTDFDSKTHAFHSINADACRTWKQTFTSRSGGEETEPLQLTVLLVATGNPPLPSPPAVTNHKCPGKLPKGDTRYLHPRNTIFLLDLARGRWRRVRAIRFNNTDFRPFMHVDSAHKATTVSLFTSKKRLRVS